jgi:hypothetical protein
VKKIVFWILFSSSILNGSSVNNYYTTDDKNIICAPSVSIARAVALILAIDVLLEKRKKKFFEKYESEIAEELQSLACESLGDTRPEFLSQELLNENSPLVNFAEPIVTDLYGHSILKGSGLYGYYHFAKIPDVEIVKHKEVAFLYKILVEKLHSSFASATCALPVTIYEKNGFCTQHRIVTFHKTSNGGFKGISNSNFSENFPEVSKFQRLDFSKICINQI